MIARPPSHVGHHVTRLRDGAWSEDDDVLAAEEPLEIRLIWQDASGITQRKNIAVTMRTPGDDFELAAGFLHGEGILRTRTDVADVAYCTDEDETQTFNIVNVTLTPGVQFDPTRLERNFYTTSSCGVCGKAALENIETQGCEALPDGFQVSSDVIRSLPSKLREAQAVFERTGGLHAAGLFDANGTLLSLREDVGRHNAVDKLIGEALLAGAAPPTDRILMLSGRASFELLQKALVARIPLVAAVGAPSSLAVELAESFNVTLCGFVRADGLNVYTAREDRSLMEPQIKVWVEEGGRTVFGDQEVRVLEAIAARGTLAEVAAALGMSYRGLWGKLKEMEANLGTKLVRTTVGGSGGGRTELTEVAQRLVDLYSSFRGAVGDFAVQQFEPCSAFLDDGCETWRDESKNKTAEAVS